MNETETTSNIQIDISENGKTTLATAGKYCDRNIDVNVNVEAEVVDNIADFVQGTIAGEYVSDKVTSLKMAAFAQCKALTSVSLPKCTEFASFRTFFGCENIVTLNLPSLTTIYDGTNAFGTMRKLQEIRLPNLTRIDSMSSTFDNCESVEIIDLSKLGGATIGANAFKNCYKLHTLILGGDALNPLGNTNAFSNVGVLSDKPFYIYVPDSLFETYTAETTTNWNTLRDKIKPRSELEV